MPGNMLAVYDVYDISQIVRMKVQFKLWLNDMVEREKKYCKRRHAQRQMVPEMVDLVHKMLEKCATPWQIEALRRLMMNANIIPSFRAIELLAQKLQVESRQGLRKRNLSMV